LWLIVGRATIVTLLLGSGLVMEMASPGMLAVAADDLLALLAATYALTVLYGVLLKRTGEHPWLTGVQLAVDAGVVSLIVLLTGGINSYFSSLYSLPIIAASIVGARRGGLLVGALSCVLYVGIVSAQYAGLPGFVRPGQVLPPIKLSLYTVGLNVFGFSAITLLTGYLGERLRQA
jgi:two-component system sensor histidine kinase PilS (NtrC family)